MTMAFYAVLVCWYNGARKVFAMKRTFSARVWKEDDWYIAQCVEVDVASQGKTEDEALSNLREALELHFEPPTASIAPKLANIEVELGAA